MAYEKQTFVDGETVLCAAHLTHMEEGIEEAHKKAGIPEFTESDNGKVLTIVDGVATWTEATGSNVLEVSGVSF